MLREEEKKFTVRICEDYVHRDPSRVKEILDRVSKIISNSYITEVKEGTHNEKVRFGCLR
jgi:competence transcription factor ComK